MGVIIGVVVGYMMGAKADENELEEIKKAWRSIRSSEEAKDIVAGGLAMAKGLVGRAGGMLADRLQAAGSNAASVSALRPTG